MRGRAEAGGGLGKPAVGQQALLSAPFSPQLSSLTQAHQEALSSLTHKAGGLEKSLSSPETRRSEEAKELAAAQREAELLRQQLR